MKNTFAILTLFITTTIFAQWGWGSGQAPQGFNYQATVRNNSGQLLLNQMVLVKFTILQDSAKGAIVYSENQSVKTDDLGHINIVVGQGTATVGTFASIYWASGTYYMGIELNTGNGYVEMGTTQLLSVPYALYALNSANSEHSNSADYLNWQPQQSLCDLLNNPGRYGGESACQHKIQDLSNPTNPQDAATKDYVDTQLQSQIANLQSQIAAMQALLSGGTEGQGLTLCDGLPKWTTGGICPPKVGDNYEGGIIIHINQPGELGYIPGQIHGIIASTIDQTINSTSSYYPGETGCMWQPGTYSWSQQTSYFNITNANGVALGTGGQNTSLILAVSQQTLMPFPAASLASKYNGGGFNNWVLPSKEELGLLYKYRNLIGGFANGWYWSSTEKNDAYVDALDFSTGDFSDIGGYKGPGGTSYKVRAVRYF